MQYPEDQAGINGVAMADGFDKLAAFGNSQELGGIYRWIIDTNNDGVVSADDGEFPWEQPALPGFNIAGAIPIAGNFDPSDDDDENWALQSRPLGFRYRSCREPLHHRRQFHAGFWKLIRFPNRW